MNKTVAFLVSVHLEKLDLWQVFPHQLSVLSVLYLLLSLFVLGVGIYKPATLSGYSTISYSAILLSFPFLSRHRRKLSLD